MKKITFILGLCASGKSFRANKIAEKTKALLIDEGFIPGIGPLFEENYKKVVKQLNENKECVVIEIAYCQEIARNFITEQLERDVPDVQIKWLCIDNNLEIANKNVEIRESKKVNGDANGHIDINNRVSKIYTYPDDGEIIPIFDLENNILAS